MTCREVITPGDQRAQLIKGLHFRTVFRAASFFQRLQPQQALRNAGLHYLRGEAVVIAKQHVEPVREGEHELEDQIHDQHRLVHGLEIRRVV